MLELIVCQCNCKESGDKAFSGVTAVVNFTSLTGSSEPESVEIPVIWQGLFVLSGFFEGEESVMV